MKESFENALVPCGGIGIPLCGTKIPQRGTVWKSLKNGKPYKE